MTLYSELVQNGAENWWRVVWKRVRERSVTPDLNHLIPYIKSKALGRIFSPGCILVQERVVSYSYKLALL
jgi:hypothetical protein